MKRSLQYDKICCQIPFLTKRLQNTVLFFRVEGIVYLKALEIQGFKSFADKTRLTFEKDITAIVGPNGSGKSNISDAILWVMGEQRSKALRGNKMEDVIFGGTEVRSPMGFAQVSLILDNSNHLFEAEGSELMLTRRYYRSGESEYYINKEPVRLKDINALLMDTGLGRDGYSIIARGRSRTSSRPKARTGARSLKKRRAFRDSATARKRPSANWKKRRRTFSASTTKSRSWNSRSDR